MYSNDTLFISATLRGTDLVTLFVRIPLLILSFIKYRRGTFQGGLLLAGVLSSYFLYISASLGRGTAKNNLFLVDIALFTANFYACAIVLYVSMRRNYLINYPIDFQDGEWGYL